MAGLSNFDDTHSIYRNMFMYEDAIGARMAGAWNSEYAVMHAPAVSLRNGFKLQ